MVGAVVWITGLASSGKTTFMKALAGDLKSRGVHPIQLDGDELRRVLRLETSAYDIEGRLATAHQFSDLCQMLAIQGHLVLIATIALFHEIQEKNRRELPNYLEVLMDTPLEVAKARDSKGVYSGRATPGEGNVVGVSWKAEFPVNPDFRIPPSTHDYELGLVSVRERVMDIRSRDAQVGRKAR